MHKPLRFKLPALLLIAALVFAAFGGAAAVRTAAVPEQTVRLPILMYHSVCVNDRVRSEYVLPPERFRADMEYLKAHGYTTVFLAEARDYVNGAGPLPEKPVVVTLDDGFLNSLTEVLPVLEALDMKAEINVVGEFCLREETARYRSPAYSYLSPSELCALRDSGRFEIGSHTFALHSLRGRRGCAKTEGESAAAYEETLREDLRSMRELLLKPCGIETSVFAYPFGAYGKETEEILKRAGFDILLTCSETVNELYPGAPLTSLGRINRPASAETAAFMANAGIR